MNSIRLDTRAAVQVTLPLRHQGHGFVPTVSIAERAFAASLIDSAKYRSSIPGRCLTEEYAAEAQPVISTYFSPFHVPPQALTAAELAAHPVHTQNQLSRVAQEQRAIEFWRDVDWDMFVESGQSPPDPPVDHRAREQSLSTLGASFLAATPTTGNFVQPKVWRVMLSLHLRLSVYDDTILPLYCRQCHSTMDSEGDHATLNCNRAPCGWVSRHDHIKHIIGRERLNAAGINFAFEVPMLIPHSDKRPGDLFACLEAPSPSNPVPRNTAIDVTVRSSRVAARRRHAAEKPGGSATFAEQEKRNDLKKAIAAASAAAATQVPTLSWDFQPLSFDQYAAPGANTLEFLEKLSIRIAERAYCSPGAALRRLFRAISYSIWSDQALAVLARQPSSTFVYPSPSMPS
jgi:hypothetical protein